MISFVLFVGIGVFGGGDAISGKESVGKYFLGSHGQYTEVSKAFFTCDRFLAYWVFVNFPIFLFWSFWVIGRQRSASP
jgi:hypothetical protein